MVTIRDIRAVTTAPRGSNLVVVRVDTSEPGLYGWGCATFTQRYQAVTAAVEEHLKPLLLGRDADRIEDIWRIATVNGYWRMGPVLNNAASGIDQALWDIKGKRAGMPVYDLLGGKYREAVPVYRHVGGGADLAAMEDSARKFLADGVRHLRIQYGGYGHAPVKGGVRPESSLPGDYYDPQQYVRNTLRALEHMRTVLGDEVELLHDVHERLHPSEAVQLAKDVERFRLFFLEDALAPEDIDWFANIRSVCTTPQAMGELFVHPREWIPLVQNRLIDFVRCHISDIGGITPARKLAALCETYGVRTAWHGPGDVSPIGHAANVHLDLASPAFGIQEFSGFSEAELEVFPGAPQIRDGYLLANDRPGWGMEVDEKAAAKFPCKTARLTMPEARRPDGGASRP